MTCLAPFLSALILNLQGLKPYSFGYEVKDPEGALDFGHRETSDGHTISGVYHVLLPDGRHQVRTPPRDAHAQQTSFF